MWLWFLYFTKTTCKNKNNIHRKKWHTACIFIAFIYQNHIYFADFTHAWLCVYATTTTKKNCQAQDIKNCLVNIIHKKFKNSCSFFYRLGLVYYVHTKYLCSYITMTIIPQNTVNQITNHLGFFYGVDDSARLGDDLMYPWHTTIFLLLD